jgi:hypothetical protein
MAVLKKLMAYALCDSLGIKLTYDPADNSLRGASEHVVNASGLRFTVASEVVSSWLAATVHVVIVKCVGNLALLAVGKPTNACSDVDLHLLNLAKMDQAAGWLEKEKPASLEVVMKRLDKAIVASFRKTSSNKWEEI